MTKKADELQEAGQALFDALQTLMEAAPPEASIDMWTGLKVVAAKEKWLKATGKIEKAA